VSLNLSLTISHAHAETVLRSIAIQNPYRRAPEPVSPFDFGEQAGETNGDLKQ
jgi:hypothetical protein